MPSVVNDNWHSNGTWARSVPPWSGPTANGSNNGDSSHISARTTAQLHSNDGAQPARRSFRGSVLSAPVRRPGIPLLSTAVVSTITAIFLFLLVVLAGLYTALYNSPRIADFGVDELHCNWILSSIKALNHFPLPYPIDREVHGRVLGKMGRGHMLRHLEDTHSDARSNLSATVEEMIGFTAKGAQLYSRLPIEDTFVRLDRDIDTLLYRLERTDYQLGALGDIYGLVGEVYHTLHKSALEELEDGQLTTDEEFWIRAQPVLLTWIGYSNMTKLYLDPLWEKARGNDEALLGLKTWQRDTRRVQQIIRVVQEMRRGLQLLAASLPSRDTATSDHLDVFETKRWKEKLYLLLQGLPGAKIMKPPVSKQRWLNDWFRQRTIDDNPLKEAWLEGLSSVDDEEIKLPMEIQLEWCE